MLIPFRWLLYGAATAVQSSGTRRHRKIQRKLRRRLAQWSEAIAPPRLDVIAPVQGIALNPPHIAPARVSVAAPVTPTTLQLGFDRPAISMAAAVAPISARLEVAEISVEAGIDLFDYEIAALMAA